MAPVFVCCQLFRSSHFLFFFYSPVVLEFFYISLEVGWFRRCMQLMPK